MSFNGGGSCAKDTCSPHAPDEPEELELSPTPGRSCNRPRYLHPKRFSVICEDNTARQQVIAVKLNRDNLIHIEIGRR